MSPSQCVAVLLVVKVDRFQTRPSIEMSAHFSSVKLSNFGLVQNFLQVRLFKFWSYPIERSFSKFRPAHILQ